MNGFIFRWLLLALAVCPVLLNAGQPSLPSSSSTGGEPNEARLIRDLQSTNFTTAQNALDDLDHHFLDSTNSLPAIIHLLKDRHLRRWAVRVLGDRHVNLAPDDLKLVFNLLHSAEMLECMDGLKAMRDLREPDSLRPLMVQNVVALLSDPAVHVVRDACRTLAVIGTPDAIPALQPLLQNPRSDVRDDAQDAINAINAGK